MLKIISCNCFESELDNGDDFIKVKLLNKRDEVYSIERITPSENTSELLLQYGKYCQHCGKKIEVESI